MTESRAHGRTEDRVREVSKGRFSDDAEANLNAWDEVRPIREALPETLTNEEGDTVDNVIHIPMSVIEKIYTDEFKCPICLDTLTQTWAVTSCLHRFCRECLHQSLRIPVTPNKTHECPYCKAKIPSRRASKPDEKFDAAIQTILSSNVQIEDSSLSINDFFNRKHRDVMKTLVAESSANHSAKVKQFKEQAAEMQIKMNLKRSLAHTKDKNATKKQQQQHTSENKVDEGNTSSQYNGMKRDKKAKTSSTQPSSAVSSSSSILSSKDTAPAPAPVPPQPVSAPQQPIPRVLFAVYPLPEWVSQGMALIDVSSNPMVLGDTLALKKPFLKAPHPMKIGDLKQFLRQKYMLSEKQFSLLEIVIDVQDKRMVLDEFLTMRDVVMQFWTKERELVLHFRLVDAS